MCRENGQQRAEAEAEREAESRKLRPACVARMANFPWRLGNMASARRRPRPTTPRRTAVLLAVALLTLRSPYTTTIIHASSTPFSTSSSNLFRGVGDDSPLARTMKGARGSTWIGEGAGGRDPYTVAAPGAEPLKLSHGTTTVALLCEGGVIAAVDSRASMGSFVSSRTTQKVIPVSEHILGTMAGGAADCTFWLRYLGMQAKIFEGRNGFPMPVATAARVLADTLLGQRGRGLSVGTMIMGYDGGKSSSNNESGSGGGSRSGAAGGGQVYYVDSDGARVKGRYFSVGSGSTYAYSVLDEGYREGMPVEEAAALAKRAVRHATYRDAFSGGFINVFRIDASGWTRLDVDDAGFLDFKPTPLGLAPESTGGTAEEEGE